MTTSMGTGGWQAERYNENKTTQGMGTLIYWNELKLWTEETSSHKQFEHINKKHCEFNVFGTIRSAV